MVLYMKNKIQKEPFSLKAIRWAYPKLETVVPPLAHKIAWNLFFSPFRFKRPEREKIAYESAKTQSININNKNVMLYEWGSKGNPIAVLIHGWSGRATQLYKFIDPLIALGYHVIGFDAPAHGDSQGKITSIDEFYQVLAQIEKNIGNIKVGIGHSFGGVSLLYAKKEGIDLQTIIMISSPTIGEDILTGFRKKISASKNTSNAMRKMVKQHFNLDFEAITACELAKEMPVKNHLIVHDYNDMEVPYQNAEALQKVSVGAEILLTKELGHTRILRDNATVETIIHFINKSTNQA